MPSRTYAITAASSTLRVERSNQLITKPANHWVGTWPHGSRGARCTHGSHLEGRQGHNHWGNHVLARFRRPAPPLQRATRALHAVRACASAVMGGEQLGSGGHPTETAHEMTGPPAAGCPARATDGGDNPVAAGRSTRFRPKRNGSTNIFRQRRGRTSPCLDYARQTTGPVLREASMPWPRQIGDRYERLGHTPGPSDFASLACGRRTKRDRRNVYCNNWSPPAATRGAEPKPTKAKVLERPASTTSCGRLLMPGRR